MASASVTIKTEPSEGVSLEQRLVISREVFVVVIILIYRQPTYDAIDSFWALKRVCMLYISVVLNWHRNNRVCFTVVPGLCLHITLMQPMVDLLFNSCQLHWN